MRLLALISIAVTCGTAAWSEITVPYWKVKDMDGVEVVDSNIAQDGTVTLLLAGDDKEVPTLICQLHRDMSRTDDEDTCRELGE